MRGSLLELPILDQLADQFPAGIIFLNLFLGQLLILGQKRAALDVE